MPRNKARNLYITVGFPHDSYVVERLKAESKQSGVSLAKLIPVKLAEFYSGQAAPKPVTESVRETSPEENALAFLSSEE